jgi:NAD(P)-dependent dehydrogenase (short-subunit alcohol dehydrogenase family)
MGLLDGKVAVITGAGRGLGEAYAKLLASEGAAVVINDVGVTESGVSSAEAAAAAIRAHGGKALADMHDVSTTDGGRALVEAAVAEFGGVHILINNAGILRDKSILKTEDADWDAVVAVNLRSAYTVTKPAFAWMKANGGGVIVNTSSTSGLIGNFGQGNYAASKGGVWAFSNVLALEGAKAGIRVWTLAPAALSPLTAHLVDAKTAAELQPEHVAPAVLYMVSSLSGQRTGHCLFVSGQKIMELKLQAAEGVPGAGRDPALDAHGIARAAESIFHSSPSLTLADLSN